MKIAVSNNHTQQSSQLSKQEAPPSRRGHFELLKNHPWLLLVIVGALSVAIAAVAISSLVSIGRIDKPVQTSSNPDETTQFSQPQPNKSTNWLLAIVLLGAGGGAVVLYHRRRKGLAMPNFSWDTARSSWDTARSSWQTASSRLKRRQQRKLLLQQSKTNAFTVPQPNSESTPIATVEPQPIALSPTTEVAIEDNNSCSIEPEVFVLSLQDLDVDADLRSPAQTEVIEATLDSIPETVVTILPPEEEQTIDPSTQPLAEMMDIRKHLSISAILQDYKPNKSSKEGRGGIAPIRKPK